jgi:hypothetical protein
MALLVKTAPGSVTTTPTGAFTARIAQLGVVDRDGDVTVPGAFPLGRAVAVSTWMHASFDKAHLPVGRATLSERDGYVIASGRLFLDMAAGRETYAALSNLAELVEWSYGYVVIDARDERRDGRVVRVLRKLDVFEVSPVLRGAGIATGTVEISSRDPVQLELARMHAQVRRDLLRSRGDGDPIQEWARRTHAQVLRDMARHDSARPAPAHKGADQVSILVARCRANGVTIA